MRSSKKKYMAVAGFCVVIVVLISSRHFSGMKQNRFQRVSFETLAGYDYSNSRTSSHAIPEKVRSLNGKDISIRGFMFPLESDGERLTTFMLVKDQASCCFGGTPKVNHWIYVQMEGDKKADYVDSVPVTVFGKLNIGETTVEEMK